MKKLLAFSLLTTSIFFGANSVRSDNYDAFGITYSGNSSIGNYIWGVNSKDGSKTLLSTKLLMTIVGLQEHLT